VPCYGDARYGGVHNTIIACVELLCPRRSSRAFESRLGALGGNK